MYVNSEVVVPNSVVPNHDKLEDFSFTIWDVGHGLCMWIRTPKGQNHWIDCGANTDLDFSPAEHVSSEHDVEAVDYLVISHPDTDHLRDLCSLVAHVGEPRVLLRNKTLPPEEKYKSGELGCQQAFKELDLKYRSPVDWAESPENPAYNGGVEIASAYNNYNDTIRGNNTSVVIMYFYEGWLFVCPGDIEDAGWQQLWATNKSRFEPLIKKSKWRVLVAPHHGRCSGYSQAMMDAIDPHLVIVSDVAGQSDTDRRCRENPQGLNIIVAPGTEKRLYKFLSTKQGGRLRFDISQKGGYKLHQYEYEYWK